MAELVRREDFAYESIGRTSPSEVVAISAASELHIGHTAVYILDHPDTRTWWQKVLGRAAPDVVEYALCADDEETAEVILSEATELRAKWDNANRKARLREKMERKLWEDEE